MVAYVHPAAVRVFGRQWLVNLILRGDFARLRDAAPDLAHAAYDRALEPFALDPWRRKKGTPHD